MTMMYEYVVLQLTPNRLRGEHVNIGIAIFPSHGKPFARVVAPVSKVRALDSKWDAEKQNKLRTELERLLTFGKSKQDHIDTLVQFGFVQTTELGFFYASSDTVEQEINDISKQYIINKVERKQRRPSLHRELTNKFKQMNLLGSGLDDLPKHLVVPHVPIPQFPDLKADFVFKNGVYRLTQTLDYRVSASAAHQKVTEACTKAMAGREAAKAWGDNTKKFALVCIPEEVAPIADSHIDLLLANGFDIFHYDNPNDLGRYHSEALSYQ